MSMLDGRLRRRRTRGRRDAVADVAAEFDIAFRGRRRRRPRRRSTDEYDQGSRRTSPSATSAPRTTGCRCASSASTTSSPLTAAGINANPALLDALDVLWIGSSLNFTDAPGCRARRPSRRSSTRAARSSVAARTRRSTPPSPFGLVSGTAGHRQRLGQRHRRRRHPGGLGARAVRPGHARSSTRPIRFTALGATSRSSSRYAAATRCWRVTGGPRTATNGPDERRGPAPRPSRARSRRAPRRSCSAPRWSTAPTPRAVSARRRVRCSGRRRTVRGRGAGRAADRHHGHAGADGPVTYPGDVVVDVLVSSEDGTPTGTVAILDEAENEVATASLDGGGGAVVRVPGIRPGRHLFTAAYTPDSERLRARARARRRR